MSTADHVPPALLEPALEAALRALRELEDDQVPAGLRRVVSYTGGRLPPPFARRLIEALDEDEWLRGEALEAWGDADPEHGDPARAAGALFLLRPEGWELRLGTLAGRASAGEREEAVARLSRRVAELEREAADTHGRADQARAAARRSREEAERKVREARSDVREARRAGREELEEARRLTRERAEELERARERLEEERTRMEVLREELLRAKRASETTASPPAGPGVWSARDGLELARVLDQVALAADRGVVRDEPPPGRPAEELRLPGGLRPDASGAVDWLLGRAAPLTVLVDGYNVAFALESSRDRLNRELARLRRQAAGPMRVMVVYDSSLPGGGDPPGQAFGGVEVRFTEAGRTADEVVIELAGSIDGPVVVFSNDREVREGAERAGALALWSDALVGWIRGR